ncbi:MAG: hypothetical protein LBV74_03360 [Tannerella sp.]|jgi:hypothetical protein|nr:hypothetical protein [Tannerella sp.]
MLYKRNDLHRSHWSKDYEDEKCYKLLDGNIGYVTLASIKDEDVSVIKETFKECKGIIIDIRNYPSTFVPFSLGSYFVSLPTPFVKFMCGNANNPGEFTFTPNLEIENSGEFYQGKLVVLVNENTQRIHQWYKTRQRRSIGKSDRSHNESILLSLCRMDLSQWNLFFFNNFDRFF